MNIDLLQVRSKAGGAPAEELEAAYGNLADHDFQIAKTGADEEMLDTNNMKKPRATTANLYHRRGKPILSK